MLDTTDTYLYEQIANDLSRAIHKGVYDVAQKLPSLRYISEQYEVSMATVIQAYQRLEHEGLIESRPKSGYFVSQQVEEQLEEPVITRENTAIADDKNIIR